MELAPCWSEMAFWCREIGSLGRDTVLSLVIMGRLRCEMVPDPRNLRSSHDLDRRECRDRSLPRRREWSGEGPFCDSVATRDLLAALILFPELRFRRNAATWVLQAGVRPWKPPSAG